MSTVFVSWLLCIVHVSSICLPPEVANGEMTIQDKGYDKSIERCIGFSEPKCAKEKCKWVKYWESGQSWIVNEAQSNGYNALLKGNRFDFWEHSGHWRNPLRFPGFEKSTLNPSNKDDWAKMTEEQQAFVLQHDQYPPIAYPSIELMEKLMKLKKAEKPETVSQAHELLMNEGFIEIAFHNAYKDKSDDNVEIEETKEVITVYDVDKRSIQNAVSTQKVIDEAELLLSMDFNQKDKKLWSLAEFAQNIAAEQKQIRALEDMEMKEPDQSSSPKHKTVHDIPNTMKIKGKVHQKHEMKGSRRLLGAVPSRRRLIWGRDIRLPVRHGAGAGFLNDHTNPAAYPVDNTMEPFKSVGAIHKWNRRTGRWEPHCTAWALTPRIIVTNGHCIGFVVDRRNWRNNMRPEYQWQPLRAMRFRPGWTGTASGFNPRPPQFGDFADWALNQNPNAAGATHGIMGATRWYVGDGDGNGPNPNKGLPGDRCFDGAPAVRMGQQILPIDQGNGLGIGNDGTPNGNCNYGYPGDNAQICRQFGRMFGRYHLPDDFETVWVAKGWLEPVPMGWTWNGNVITNSDAEITSLANAKRDNTHDFAIIRLRADRAINAGRHPYFWLSRVSMDRHHLNSQDPQYYRAPVLHATAAMHPPTYTGIFTSGYPGVWAYNQMTNYFDGSGGGAHGSIVDNRDPALHQWRLHDNLQSGASGSPYIQRDALRRRVFGIHANVFGAGGAKGLEISQSRYNSICAKVNFDSAVVGGLLCPLVVRRDGRVLVVAGGVMDVGLDHAVQSQENIFDDDFGYTYGDGDDEMDMEDEKSYYPPRYYYYESDNVINLWIVIGLVLIIMCVCVMMFAAFGLGCGYFMDDCVSLIREDERVKLIV